MNREVRPRFSVLAHGPATFLMPLAVAAGLWLTRSNNVSAVQFLAALGLLVMPWWSYSEWKRSGKEFLPVFTLLAGVYCLYFVLPLFWGDRFALDWRNPNRQVSDGAITRSLLMVLVGLGSLRAGMSTGIWRSLAARRFPDIPASPTSSSYLRFMLFAGTGLDIVFGPAAGSEAGFRQVLVLLQSALPLVAFAILFRRVLAGRALPGDKMLLMLFLAVRVIFGVSSGWVGAVVTVVLIGALAYLAERRRLPLAVGVVLLPYVLFFQAGKDEFRSRFWQRHAQASRIEKIEFWTRVSALRWANALQDPTGGRVADLFSKVVMRTSLLTQAANVIDQTPDRVPFQNGRLYSYLAVTLVPRLLWPSKPSMNEANQFYQVAYGVTPERSLQSVSIAMGALAESYANFGWSGVVGIMFGLGLILDLFRSVFLRRNSGVLFQAIGIVLLPQFLTVEYQLAQCLGGVIQQSVFTLLVCLPIVRQPAKRLPRRSSAVTSPGRGTVPRWRALWS